MLKKIEWETIHKIWRDHLWKGRVSAIKPTNGLKLFGGYDKKIEDNTPTFFGVFHGDKCVGVNSGHITGNTQYRSRGIYVFPEYRGKGFSQMLFQAVETQGRAEGKDVLWSMPRESALPAYERYGFHQVSEMFDKGMEFGPNCYVIKRI